MSLDRAVSVPSLQTICSQIIMDNLSLRSDSGVLEIFSFAKSLGIKELISFCQSIIKYRFAYFLSRYEVDQLKEWLGPSYDAVNKVYEERLRCEAFLSRKVISMVCLYLITTLKPLYYFLTLFQGTVVERQKVDLKASEGGDYFPLRALLAGVDWPVGVDPSKREQYLDPVEFKEVFGLSKVDLTCIKYSYVAE